ncbi:MAG: Wzz/FepE/Etk N-terminal domain-containing protein [Deltaproteobacteria bacterium]|jgi:chain length determinant protein (polysaccharide antigen chain regulator)|nr:Wzz/FepE/Etk N-terminal domain-containing protein [Deltaproteobacteria bacterium]
MVNHPAPSRRPVPPAVEPGHYQQYQDDEIDLIDIWRLLVRRWRWIAVITLTCTALAVAYALVAPRVYRAEAFLLPPQVGDIEQLNISTVSSNVDHLDISKMTSGIGRSGNSKVNAVSVEDVYGQTLKNLQSLSVRRLFFDEHNLLESLRGQGGEDAGAQKVFAEAFHERLTVAQGKKDRADFVTVSLEGEDPEQITSWLNTFLTMVNGYTIDVLQQNLQSNVGAKKKSIENNIHALQQVAQNRRQDRIAELQEALYIATQLGIEQRAKISPSASSPAKGNSEFGVAVNTAETPLYLRGVRELQAEIDMLQKRKSDDPFIYSLRNLQEELSRLNQIQVDTDKIKAFRLDQMAMVPDGPIKPNRKLVVALGCVLGLMLGVFAAFMVNFIETARRQERPE